MSGKLSKGLFDRPKKVFGAAGKINPGKMAQQAQQMAADQAAAPAYGEELNRINRVGTPGTRVITGAVDTGECTAGNPWHQLDIDVSVPGEASYAVSKREMVPATMVGKYAIGATRVVKVDPADRSNVIFTD